VGVDKKISFKYARPQTGGLKINLKLISNNGALAGI